MAHSLILLVHLISVGILLGGVFANLAINVGKSVDIPRQLAVANAQVRLGLLVILPALVLILMAGGSMITYAPREGSFYLKLAFGTFALFVGVGSVFHTLRLRQYLAAGDPDAADMVRRRRTWLDLALLALILITIVLAARYFVA